MQEKVTMLNLTKANSYEVALQALENGNNVIKVSSERNWGNASSVTAFTKALARNTSCTEVE